MAILLLEIGVAFLQAYVFTILVCIYLSDSLKSPDIKIKLYNFIAVNVKLY